MKRMKNLFGVILALALVLTLGIGVQAASVHTITIDSSSSGHTYEAYQIFTGTLSDTGVLSDIQWGTGVNSGALLTALKADPTVGSKFTVCFTAADVAKAMDKLTDDSAEAKAIAQVVGQNLGTVAGTGTGSGPYTISNLTPGYYLVKDQNSTQDTENGAYTRFILKVVKDVEVTPKSDVPTVVKKVRDINDSITQYYSYGTMAVQSGWQDSADYSLGGQVPFQLTGTLPSNYGDYSSYKYIFHDTVSTGLTFDVGSVKVYDQDRNEIDPSYYTVAATASGFDVQFADLKKISTITADSSIVVEYIAILNTRAVLGSPGNPNSVSLEYSNNPNANGAGDTGTTPKDTVTVFTYQVIINKVDQNNQPLTGADFTLDKYINGAWISLNLETSQDGTSFLFHGLDDGIYRLTETKTPSGYNSIDPICFTVTADHDVYSDNPQLISLSANQSDEYGTNLTEGIIATFAATLDNGTIETNIVNNAGATLPSTGGIGTTIFYVVGGLLMAGAAVVLVTRRKMSGHQN